MRYPVRVMSLKQKIHHFKLYPALFALGMILIIATLFVYHSNVKDYNASEFKQQQQVLGMKSKSSPVSPTPIKDAMTTDVLPTKTLPNRSVYLGMWTGGLWDDKALTFHPESLQTVENEIGKKVAIAHIYTGWSNLNNPSFIAQLQIISNNGWRPMVSANPYFFDQCKANGKTLYQAIASGNCDEFMKSVGVSLKQYSSPVLLRFAWEMNINSMDWSIQKTGSSTQDYILAWQRFHDIVASTGATNVLWVFAPNTQSASSIPYNQLYPGDQYVDWIGLDGYNWGTTQAWSSWESFSQVFASSYANLVAVAPNKPVMLSEVNTTDVGGDKAVWYTDMLTEQIPNKYPRISAIIIYNEDRTAQENVNWLLDKTPESLSAFKKGISNPLYVASF